MSRASVFHYKDKDVDPQAVARDLKVEAVVTGRIVQHGDQLVISSELIDARTNRNLWGDQYDRKVADALAVQQEITSAIAAKLRERLSGEESKKPVAKGGTADPEAYQLYLKGRYLWQQRTQQSLDKSKAYFEQAIARDPNYAMAYLGLADYYIVLPDYSPVRLRQPQARRARPRRRPSPSTPPLLRHRQFSLALSKICGIGMPRKKVSAVRSSSIQTTVPRISGTASYCQLLTAGTRNWISSERHSQSIP